MGAVRVVVVGAGFGGLELAARLSAGFGGEGDIVLIDANDAFHFGFSKLDVLVGAASAEAVQHPYDAVAFPGVRFVKAEVTAIDAAARRVETAAGGFEADVLVIATGAVADAALTPGLAEHGNEFYTFDGTLAARDALTRLVEAGGGRVLIAVAGAPFKCPPAPSEAALLVHDLLTERGVRERSTITLAMPFGRPIPPSPEGSGAVLAACAERGIVWRAGAGLASVEPGVATLSDGSREEFDLLLAVPLHRVPGVVTESGLCQDGWVAVDTETLRATAAGIAENVYAIGDVAAANCPKAGAFATAQAAVVADQIVALARGGASAAAFDGTGACLMEFGGGAAARVAITGRVPAGGFTSTFSEPGPQHVADKLAFEAETVARWFAGEPAVG